ncbi:MAG TPA: FtsW/RodA/SpoVE family cell cycle protein [Candidatus Paceibacterota bacterium]|nr:FtsW/RodA/SpoVE family cell cycle protein [Candidatus Paceibacterota bacterium]
MFKYLKQLDWILIICAFLLVIIGLLSIYSSSSGRGDFLNFEKQLIFLGIGIFLMFFFCFFDWRAFRENSSLILILYFACIVGLIGLFFLAPEIRGVQKWYKVGPFSIDPVEFMKIVLIILLAKYFSMRHIEMYRVKHIVLSGFYILLPVSLVFFQPDFGSVIILVALWIGILIASGIKLRHFLILFLCGILILTLCWLFLIKDYQKERVISFLFPADPLGADWSQNQARIAIGSGGIFGQGIFNGSQTRYGFLPEPQTDFIFAAVAEEAGLVGVSALLILYLVLILRIFKIAMSSQSNFPRLFCIGLVIVLISQIFIHIGMNLGILPIIGISLPLVSYGGSGLITILVSLGIIQSIKNSP